MKHILSAVIFLVSLAFPHFSIAVTAEDTLILSGRSIPENSISISPPRYPN